MEKCAVFSCMGLGDGLISLVLSNNLHLNGYPVDTFHPFLQGMQQWFPHLPLKALSSTLSLEEQLQSYDRFFIFYEKSPAMQAVLAYCETHYPQQTIVLNPIATRRKDYPYWAVGRFEGDRTFVENLFHFCGDGLGMKVRTRSNGIRPVDGIDARKNQKQIVIHPESSREGKNWPQKKYSALNQELKKRGFEPCFLLTQEERSKWDDTEVHIPHFSTLSEMAQLIYESGYMIGNDSGIGHLASCLGLPTVTICRSPQASQFWRPGWAPGKVITPSLWIPNLKGIRWRDQHWKRWVSVHKVLRAFERSIPTG